MQQNTGLENEPEKSFWPLWKVTSENFITYPGVLLVSVKFEGRLPWLTGLQTHRVLGRERQTLCKEQVLLHLAEHGTKYVKKKEKDVNLLNIFNLIKYAAAKKTTKKVVCVI